MATVKRKKKNIKLPSGILNILTTFNNTHITLTDHQGNKITWWWTGTLWFKWAKKSTPYAAEQLTKWLIQEAKDVFWLKELWVVARGLWLWRDWAFKWINDVWWVDILWIREATPIQFGWCKGKRQKRN